MMDRPYPFAPALSSAQPRPTVRPEPGTTPSSGGSSGGGGTKAVGPPSRHSPPPRLTSASSLFANRRILPPSFLPPLLCLSGPPLLLTGRAALSLLSGGYPIPTALLTVGAVSSVRASIRRFAPDEEKCADALERCRVRLPILATICVGLMFRMVVGPLLVRSVVFEFSSHYIDSNGGGASGGRHWLISFGTRLAFGTAALSLAVVGRYLGWFSVVRCSSVPLRPNPIDATISSICTRLSSFDAFLDALTGPDRRPTITVPRPPQGARSFVPQQQQQQPQPSEADRRNSAPLRGRYQRPTLSACFVQIVLHGIAGGLFANVVLLPYLPSQLGSSGAWEAPTLLTVVSILSSITTAVLVVFSDGTSHEVKYQSRADFSSSTWSTRDTIRSLAVRTASTVQRGGLIPYLVLLPLLCHAVLLVSVRPASSGGDGGFDDGAAAVAKIGSTLAALLASFAATFFVSVYLVATDVLVRRALAAPGLDVDRLLYYLPPPSHLPAAAGGGRKGKEAVPFLPEDLIVQSVLWGCDGGGGGSCLNSMVRDVVAPRLGRAAFGGGAPPYEAYGGSLNLEEEEVRRNDAAIEAVADAMAPLRPSSPAGIGFDDGAGTLEEDVLRVAILESLGGGLGIGAAAAPLAVDDDVLDEVQQSLGLSARHYIALRRRVLVSEEGSALNGGRQMQQPVIVPVVRALCAYAGGLGEALVRTSGMTDDSRIGGQGVLPPTTSLSRSRELQWYLPPGATACAEYSILAAARLVALNFTLPLTRGGGALKRRYSWLALLVPSVLHSAHRLRCGVLRYARSRLERSSATMTHGRQIGSSAQLQVQINDEALGNFIAVNCPDIRRVLTACDEAAILVMNALKDVDEMKVNVHSVCRAWLNGLL